MYLTYLNDEPESYKSTFFPKRINLQVNAMTLSSDQV